jgi:uncharacterized protein DUF4373
MPKETYYFQHDYTAGNNPKIRAMLCEYNAWGYGTYWYIVELLHQNDEHRLPLKKYIYSAIAHQMSTNVEQVINFIKDCIDEYELFHSDGVFFYSDRVNKNMEKRSEISEKRSLAGQKSAEIRLQNSTSVEQNSTKERKLKETPKERRDFVAPSLEEIKTYFDEKGYSETAALKAFEYYSARNWHNSKGYEVKSWKSTMVNVWFVPENLKSAPIVDIRTNVIDHRKNADSWR